MAVDNEIEFDLSQYVSAAKRRYLQILIVSIIAAIVAIIAIFLEKPVYEVQGQIGIESPTISKALISKGLDEATRAKYVNEHVDKVKQKIFSRENLVRLNKKYNLYPDWDKESWIANAIQQTLWIGEEQKSSDGNGWGKKVTVGFSVGFEYSDPDTTYAVINEVIKQLMDENAKDRARRATETTSFLTDELLKVQKQLDETEDKVADYKQKHANSLPEHQKLHMATLDQLRADLKSLDMEYQSAQEELRYLDVELATAHSANSTEEAVVVSNLDLARAELENARVLYKDTHPTVRSLKRKVALLEKEEAAPTISRPKKTDVAAELAIAKIQSQIEAANARLLTIKREKLSTNQQIRKVKAQIVNIPQVERGLATLLRDYENARKKYDQVKAKQINAKVAEDLELSNKSERFVLLESPEYPLYKENMRKVISIPLALIGSLGFGFAFAFMLEFFDKRIRGQNALIAITGTKPLAVIPYLHTQSELNNQKKLIKTAFIVAGIVILILVLFAISHFFDTPIDSLFEAVL